jgi:hypothetical protein
MMFTLPRYIAHFKEKGYQFAALWYLSKKIT